MKNFGQKRNRAEIRKGDPAQYKSDAKLLRYPATLTLFLNVTEKVRPEAI
jgi:hypothetical protein